jgi:hypothetical protein
VLKSFDQTYITKCNTLNIDVDLIVTNEYGKQITIPPFTL